MYKIIGADQKEYGPVTADQIRQWIAERRLNGLSLILPEGGTEWKPLAQCLEFSAALASAPGALGPVPSTTPAPLAYAGSAQVPRTNPMALTSLIMGILSISCCWCFCGFPFNLLGIIFSIVGLVQINRNPAIEEGRSLAIAGLVLSIISLLLSFLGMFLQLPGFLEQFHRQFKF